MKTQFLPPYRVVFDFSTKMSRKDALSFIEDLKKKGFMLQNNTARGATFKHFIVQNKGTTPMENIN